MSSAEANAVLRFAPLSQFRLLTRLGLAGSRDERNVCSAPPSLQRRGNNNVGKPKLSTDTLVAVSRDRHDD